MDRHTIIQLVVILVLVPIVARWFPFGPEALGFGDPLVAWRTDAFLADNDDVALAKARLIHGRRRRPSLVRHWRTALGHVEELQELASVGEVSLVQVSGMGRADLWFLTYELFPIPVTGRPYQEGSRADDPVAPGATLFPLGVSGDVESSDGDTKLRAAERERDRQRKPSRGDRQRDADSGDPRQRDP